jgi:hypothetical protein
MLHIMYVGIKKDITVQEFKGILARQFWIHISHGFVAKMSTMTAVTWKVDRVWPLTTVIG